VYRVAVRVFGRTFTPSIHASANPTDRLVDHLVNHEVVPMTELQRSRAA
jgi:hypothetical protein